MCELSLWPVGAVRRQRSLTADPRPCERLFQAGAALRADYNTIPGSERRYGRPSAAARLSGRGAPCEHWTFVTVRWRCSGLRNMHIMRELALGGDKWLSRFLNLPEIRQSIQPEHNEVNVGAIMISTYSTFIISQRSLNDTIMSLHIIYLCNA